MVFRVCDARVQIRRKPKKHHLSGGSPARKHRNLSESKFEMQNKLTKKQANEQELENIKQKIWNNYKFSFDMI